MIAPTAELTKEDATRALIDYSVEMATLLAERDKLIHQAWAAGVPMTHVAALVGLTRARCYQIKDGTP